MKKIITLLLSISMLCTLVTGCSKKASNDATSDDYTMDPVLNPLGSETICKEPVELTIMMVQNANVEDYATNEYTKEIERKGNVKLNFMLVPETDAETKLNLMLSSGSDMPDIVIYNFKDNNVSTYGDAGVIIPLNKYYKHSSEYLVPQCEQLVKDGGLDILKYITMTDGNIYTVPQYNESLQNEFQMVLWMYKPWLDKLGLDEPTTLEEFENVLQAFKDNDLNGDGNKNDEIPMIDCINHRVLTNIEQAFVRTGEDDLMVDKDGKLNFAYATDEYKEYLKYMNSLVQKGLFDKTSFSQDFETLKMLINSETPKVGVFSYTSTSILLAKAERRLDYIPVMLKGPEHTTTVYRRTMPLNSFFITKSCEHPEVAFRIADYMCSKDMTVWSRFGKKGTDWLEADEKDESLFDFLGYNATMKTVLQWGSLQNSHWQNNTPGFRTTDVVLGVVTSNDDSQKSKAIAIKKMYDEIPDQSETVEKIIYTNDELDERFSIKDAITPYVQQMELSFITGDKDIDSGWDEYIKELKNLNIDRLLEISQVAYDRMNEN